ncbi:MAG TPA: host attachment protein [Sedimenticola sp.]|nr:host attachment protein [Sedimenticola sp.]
MTTAWVLVADATRARIFSAEKPTAGLTEVQALSHPEGRLHEGDLTSDTAGMDLNGSSPTTHDMGHTSDAKQQEAIRFAEEIRDAIESGRTAGRFGKLYVIAAPAFLGILRKHYSSAMRRMIAAEIDKNLTTHDPAEIRRQLPEYL